MRLRPSPPPACSPGGAHRGAAGAGKPNGGGAGGGAGGGRWEGPWWAGRLPWGLQVEAPLATSSPPSHTHPSLHAWLHGCLSHPLVACHVLAVSQAHPPTPLPCPGRPVCLQPCAASTRPTWKALGGTLLLGHCSGGGRSICLRRRATAPPPPGPRRPVRHRQYRRRAPVMTASPGTACQTGTALGTLIMSAATWPTCFRSRGGGGGGGAEVRPWAAGRPVTPTPSPLRQLCVLLAQQWLRLWSKVSAAGHAPVVNHSGNDCCSSISRGAGATWACRCCSSSPPSSSSLLAASLPCTPQLAHPLEN